MTTLDTEDYLITDGPLATEGNQIVDANGDSVQIRAVNWFGLETESFMPHGLWGRNLEEMMDEMVELGFNTIRLPFSTELILDTPMPVGLDTSYNPDLAGMNGLEIMDRVIEYAEEIGLKVMLDHHRSEAGDGPNDNGLWYGEGGYTEADWINMWETVAARYEGNDTILGADLHNEPHNSATWGDGGATDWARAATEAGNAVLDINPDWLIVVEGIDSYDGDNYWWGGNLQGVADYPITLDVDNRLVYSPHDYPASVFEQSWFTDGSDLYEVFRENWGYIYEEGIAPVLVGEFGSRLETELDQTWAEAITTYLSGDFDGDGTIDIPDGDAGISFAWWSWNPNSGDTGGILLDDWRTPRQEALDLLEELLSTPLPDQDGTTPDPDPVVDPDPDPTPDPDPDPDPDPTPDPDPDPTPDPDPEPPTGDAVLDAAFVVTDDWGSGAVVTLTITNSGGTAVDGWAVDFDLPFDVTSSWNVDLTDTGEGFTATDIGWNGTIAPGETVTIGFQAGEGGLDADTLNAGANFDFDDGITTGNAAMIAVDPDPTPDPDPEPDTDPVPDPDPTPDPDPDPVSDPDPVPDTGDEDAMLEAVFGVVNDWGSGATVALTITNTGDEAIDDWMLDFDLAAGITNSWNVDLAADGDRYTANDLGYNGTIGAGESVTVGFNTETGDLDVAALNTEADFIFG